MPGAVFISYASQDSVAAQRLAEALRLFGVEVWFDQSELNGGEAWDRKIREQVRGCALFVPMVSAATQTRAEGYFRREWKLAAERTHDMAAGRPFILPVVIDETPQVGALVPDEFGSVQWTRFSEGVPTPRFIEQVRRLMEPKAAASTATARPLAPVQSTVVNSRRSRWLLGAVGLLVVAMAVVAGWWAMGRGSAANAVPVVLLMDSPYVDRVYDPATLRNGGTNADDITDALHDLPVTILKENTSATWHREDEVRKMRPDLVVLHRSCFYTFPANRVDELYPVMDNKLVAFFGYLATLNPRVRFIVYSRHAFENDADAAKWREEAAARFPVLAGRIETWRVPLDRATFRHPLTAQELRGSVERALGLRMTASRR